MHKKLEPEKNNAIVFDDAGIHASLEELQKLTLFSFLDYLFQRHHKNFEAWLEKNQYEKVVRDNLLHLVEWGK